MKTISDDFKNSLKNNTINLIRCWKITLLDGAILGFTTNNCDIIYDNLKYFSFSSDNIKNLESNIDIKEDFFKIQNVISTDIITNNDILSGKYNNAKVEVFLLNNFDLTQGKIVLLNGKIYDIEYKDNIFIAKVIGLKENLNVEIGEMYGPLCRANFCDKKCKLNRNNFTFTGSISEVISNSEFKTSDTTFLSKPNAYFENGVITFTSGNNKNQKMEVKQFSNGDFVLSIEMPYIIMVGDSFSVISGCDKSFKSCCNKFSNAINFRGEPHLPGIDILLKVM